MDATSYLREMIQSNQVVRFARWIDGECTGNGQGLILDTEAKIAVLLEDCGQPTREHRGLAAGAIVHYCFFQDSPTDQFRILDTPAYLRNHNRHERPKDWAVTWLRNFWTHWDTAQRLLDELPPQALQDLTTLTDDAPWDLAVRRTLDDIAQIIGTCRFSNYDSGTSIDQTAIWRIAEGWAPPLRCLERLTADLLVIRGREYAPQPAMQAGVAPQHDSAPFVQYLTHATLQRARRKGKLRHNRSGRRILYRGQWVLEWLQDTATKDTGGQQLTVPDTEVEGPAR